MSPAEVFQLYEGIVRDISNRVLAGLRERDLINQHQSPLGRRVHRQAVKRRRAEGAPGAFIQQRDCLLTREALLEELERGGQAAIKPGLRKAVARSPEHTALDRELDDELRAIRQGRAKTRRSK